MSKIISTRISEDLDNDLKIIEKAEGIDRATAIRKLLYLGLSEWKKRYALDLYLKGKISIWRGARLSGLSLCEFIDLLKENKIPLNYDIDDLRARKTARILGIKPIGTLYIILLSVKNKIITKEKGKEFLNELMRNGFYIP